MLFIKKKKKKLDTMFINYLDSIQTLIFFFRCSINFNNIVFDLKVNPFLFKYIRILEF